MQGKQGSKGQMEVIDQHCYMRCRIHWHTHGLAGQPVTFFSRWRPKLKLNFCMQRRTHLRYWRLLYAPVNGPVGTPCSLQSGTGGSGLYRGGGGPAPCCACAEHAKTQATSIFRVQMQMHVLNARKGLQGTQIAGPNTQIAAAPVSGPVGTPWPL
jgi:hypothetical protein